MISTYTTIRPAAYQLIPLTKILLNGLKGVLVCDGVGVGKTISAGYIIAYLSAIQERPAFVICGPTLIDKWILEMEQKFQMKTLPIRSVEDWETAKDELRFYDGEGTRCYIASRSLFSTGKIDKPNTEFGTVVIDEIQNFRNRETKSFENCHRFISTVDWRIGLSATPINNRLEDLGSELALLFKNRTASSWDFTLQELSSQKRMEVLSPLITRFMKDRLSIHFAERKVKAERIRLPETYFETIDRLLFEKLGKTRKQGYPLDLVTYYRLASSSSKAFLKSMGVTGVELPDREKMDRLNDVINEGGQTRWIIFCEFEETTKYIAENIDDDDYSVIRMTGNTPLSERPGLLSMFRNAPKTILVLTSVGTEGLDMQFCSAMINYDLHWNPMVLEQRIGRIDRVGQESKELMIHNFQVVGSIDDRVIGTLKKKLEVISRVFETDTSDVIERGTKLDDMRPFSEKESEVMNAEVRKAEELMRSFKLSRSLVCDDYRVLTEVNTDSCSPSKLTGSAINCPWETTWLSEDPVALNWSEELGERRIEIEEILNHYS